MGYNSKNVKNSTCYFSDGNCYGHCPGNPASLPPCLDVSGIAMAGFKEKRKLNKVTENRKYIASYPSAILKSFMN